MTTTERITNAVCDKYNIKPTKEQLEQTLIDKLHSIARNSGYVAAGIGDAGYRRIHRMTKQALTDEIARLDGKKTLAELPKDHICISVG